MFETIERLKREWTDKLVVIRSPAPELARFAQATGVVKTVNMNGRCLVEFDQFNDIGWHDIDPGVLEIVTERRPKPAPKPSAKAAAPAKAGAPAKAAAPAKPAAPAKSAAPAKAPTGAKRPSTADILAMARGAKAAAAPAIQPTPPPAASEAAASPEPAPPPDDAAAEEAPAVVVEKPAGAARGALPGTTAEKIAWCRTHDAKG